MLDLPNEVLAQIFSFLPCRDIAQGVSLTCNQNTDIWSSYNGIWIARLALEYRSFRGRPSIAEEELYNVLVKISSEIQHGPYSTRMLGKVLRKCNSLLFLKLW